ncbi:MAG TPA: FtsX-like permease family protein, partial [Cyclobacteriaceae bacterium]|nr:FtsX-like permease family protein [Cyclobacteriaceae bacterium]
SPFEPAMPTVYFTMGWKDWMLLRITPGVAVSDALPKIEKVYTSVIPDIPFDFKFADVQYAAKFETEERIGKLAAVFATLAIIISCLGLFGLASFVAEQRTKEIGIRKVLGASIVNLWRMLSREFVLLVLLSCIIAAPISYYILNEGIQRYEYRTDISLWIFAMTAVGALAITLLTVSFQSIKAALANPVKSLRSE